MEINYIFTIIVNFEDLRIFSLALVLTKMKNEINVPVTIDLETNSKSSNEFTILEFFPKP